MQRPTPVPIRTSRFRTHSHRPTFAEPPPVPRHSGGFTRAYPLVHPANVPFSTYQTPYPEHMDSERMRALARALRDNDRVVSRADIQRRFGVL
jgi:hypothetical protein